MKTKQVKQLLRIVKLFDSNDPEVVEMGIGLISQLPIIKNLNKHYKCKVRMRQFKFENIVYDNTHLIVIFSKFFLINKDRSPFIRAQAFLSWFCECIKNKNRNKATGIFSSWDFDFYMQDPNSYHKIPSINSSKSRTKNKKSKNYSLISIGNELLDATTLISHRNLDCISEIASIYHKYKDDEYNERLGRVERYYKDIFS